MSETPTTRIVTANWDDPNVVGIDGYLAAGGYEGLRAALAMTPDEVIDLVKTSGLRGRGGAGFPTGVKWSFVPQDTGKPTYVVANFDESEPGTFNNREIIEREPHRFLEGMAIAAYAVRSHLAFVYCRGEFLWPGEILDAAIREAYAKEVFGPSVLGSGFALEVVLHRGAGAYICGEETALLSSLEGYRGQPRLRPPFPAVEGLYASPTLINNVETLATVPKILEIGGENFAKLGVENSRGTRLFSLSGNVVNGGNYEVELGTSLRELIYDIGGGIPDGRELKAVIPGGSSVPVLNADEVDTALDFDSMAARGTMLGSGAVIVMDERCCMVQLGLRVAQFYMHESCGKCTPCREGTRWMVSILRRIEDGEASQGELDLLLDVCDRILGHCLCPLGDAAAMPVASYVAKFRDEYQRHIDEGGCPFHGDSTLDHVMAPVDQHHARIRAGIEVPA